MSDELITSKQVFVFYVLFLHCNLLNVWCLLFPVCLQPASRPEWCGHACVSASMCMACSCVSARCGGACVHVRACLHVFCSAGTSLPRPCVWTPHPAFSAWCLPSGANSPGLRPQPFSWSALALWVASPVVWVTAWPTHPGGLGPVGRVCPEAPSTLLCGPCLSVPWGVTLLVFGAALSCSRPPPAQQCGQFCVHCSHGCGPPFCLGTELWLEGPFTPGLPVAPSWSQAPGGCQDSCAWA